MTNEKTQLDKLLDYAESAMADGYPYEVIDGDLALTVKALRAFKASQNEPSGDGWQPISRVPNGDEVRMFWVRPKRPEESYVNSSGQPVVSGGEPHIHIGKYLSWSSLSTATHWRPMPGPPSENREGSRK